MTAVEPANRRCCSVGWSASNGHFAGQVSHHRPPLNVATFSLFTKCGLLAKVPSTHCQLAELLATSPSYRNCRNSRAPSCHRTPRKWHRYAATHSRAWLCR